MCSISGAIHHTGVIQKMIDLQQHRAPDEGGTYINGEVELGMGRLKIIDLISPNLAPYTEDEFVLCYNGEIYNYRELRQNLESLGWKFTTQSDTEVLLKAWRQWNVGMFDKLNGMYAFGIYNSKDQTLTLARDIAGEKPLYYSKQGKRFYFASEAKAIHGVAPTEIVHDEFYRAFQHCYDKTLFKDVYSLLPAHYLVLDCTTNEYQIHEYWKPKIRAINLKTAHEELMALLEDSVRLRLQADVPHGLYYSKGIDSSIISTFHNFEHTFYFDDTLDWKDDFFATIDKIAYHLDFPVGSLSSFPLWKLAESAHKKVKVVISGEGADELFGGYVRYKPIFAHYELYRQYPSYDYIFSKYMPANYLHGFAKITARNENVEFVADKLKPFFDHFEDPINATGYADFKLVMPSLLQMGDRMASAFGIENRCPFLDKRIIEFAFSLPPEYKIANGRLKLMLRDICEARGLTEPLVMEKKGLTIRFNQWFGANDWNRDRYFNMLNATWQKQFGDQTPIIQ